MRVLRQPFSDLLVNQVFFLQLLPRWNVAPYVGYFVVQRYVLLVHLLCDTYALFKLESW